jgi:hypothetical protein
MVLLRALLKPSLAQMNALNTNAVLVKKKRNRLLPLCYEIITLLNTYNLAHLMAPVGTRYMISEGGKLAFLRAIYYRALSERDDEE